MAATNQQIAAEVLMGKWGNGLERRQRLEAAGYDYAAIQSIVNALISGSAPPADTVDSGRYLEVVVDLKEYDGIQLKIIN